MEAVDLALTRLVELADETDSILVITADHGNAEEMYEKSDNHANPKPKTSHTTNRVPFIIYGADVKLKEGDNIGLSNIAATIAELLGVKPNEHWNESLICNE